MTDSARGAGLQLGPDFELWIMMKNPIRIAMQLMNGHEVLIVTVSTKNVAGGLRSAVARTHQPDVFHTEYKWQ